MYGKSELDLVYFYFLPVALMSPMSLVENITWFLFDQSPSPLLEIAALSALGNALLYGC